MRIGIDALYIRPGKVGGTESYLRNLLNGLEQVDKNNQYYIFTSKINTSTFKFKNDNFYNVLCDIDGSSRLNRVIYTNFVLPGQIRKLDLDLMFFPTYIRTLFKLRSVKTISNIHDIQYKHFPQYFSKIQKAVFTVFYNSSLKKSDKIVCISNFVKDDLVSKFPGIDATKYTVIHNPIDFNKFDSARIAPFELLITKFRLETKKYLLSVASLLPHKNINTLIDAFAKFKTEDVDGTKLVLVGVKEKSTGELMDRIRLLGLDSEVVIPGFVQDEELSLLYNNAGVFISTSLFEGFGMPPVEAMYKKLPTITTKCASLPEVTMNKAIYYEDALDSSELATQIKITLQSPPDENTLDEISKEFKKAYSQDKIAGEYIEFFEKMKIH